MCGIAGIVGPGGELRDNIYRMVKKQRHRGPDAEGTWFDEKIGLGHNRLSIIDLSDNGNQPMFSDDRNYVIVFNGEIYNYLELKRQCLDYNFKSTSDTEILLALYKKYGKDMLNLLNGMFSFAIWDINNQTLFAARDRFGVKPFYYAYDNENLYFASEIKTIWEADVPKKENEAVWAKYFVYGSYGLPDETFWYGIKQLPAGHYLEFNLKMNSLNITKWYDFINIINNTPLIDDSAIKKTYLELLIDSINLRFRSDVPVGFNISGGLDSSSLLALVNYTQEKSSEIEAFTFYSNDSNYDELPWVNKMIQLTNNPLNKCLFNLSDVTYLISKVNDYQDEPYGGFPTLAYSNIFKHARNKGCIVLLDGMGMDEAWAGYDYYRTNSGFTIQGVTKNPCRPELLNHEFRALAEKENYPEPFDNQLQNLQYRDLFYTKIPRALRFNDRISMMHSTELREPFLDHRLVELAFAQDYDLKIRNNQSKWILREIVKDFLGSDIAFAPKRPLQTPQREWLANDLSRYITDLITNNKSETINGWFKNNSVLNAYSEYKSSSLDNSFFVWQIINTYTLLK